MAEPQLSSSRASRAPERTFLVDLQSADGERNVHFLCMAPSQREAMRRSTCIYPDLRVVQITTDDGSRWVFPHGSAEQPRSRAGRRTGRMRPPPAIYEVGPMAALASKLLAPGRKAPAISTIDHAGTKRTLAECKGRYVVLFFYPKDDTPGCTVEACSFRDDWAVFRKAGIEVFGISPDGAESHVKFIRKFHLPFPLLVDEPAKGKAPKICSAYGTWQEKSMYGRKYMGVVRTTYVIAPDGKVALRIDKVRPEGHAEEVIAAIKALTSAACTPSNSASSASTKARSSPRTKARTPRASTSTPASKRR